MHLPTTVLRPSTLAPLVIAAICPTVVARGDEQTVEKTTVYTSGQSAYHTYRIPSLLVTPKGSLLAFAEGRRGGSSDTGDIDLLVKRSDDQGKTWSAAQTVWDDGPNVCGNPCPVVDRDTGTIWLLLTWNRGDDAEPAIIARRSKDSRRVFVSRSDDDGRTWSPPREITADAKKPDWTWYATGPGAGVQIENVPHKGRLVIPCDHIEAGSRRYLSHVIVSDDHGKTWRLGGSSPRDAVNECEVVELAGGRLMLNMRNYDRSMAARQTAVSDDGGDTWTNQKHDPALVEPICQASIRRLAWPVGDRPGVILFSNPASRKRERMTVRASLDDGQTWAHARLLDPRPSAYSCLAAMPDGSVGVLYEAGSRRPYEQIVFARFGLAWLTAPGRAPPAPSQVALAADALQDRSRIAHDGKSPNKLVCDTTLRALPDGSWALFMLAGDDFEPSPKNHIALTRSKDQGTTWSPLEEVPTGLPRSGKTSGQGLSELMVHGGRCTLFFSTHSQTWGRDWKSWVMTSDDSCRTWSKAAPLPGRLADFTFVRNHIVTRDGRILVPFQHYLGPGPGVPPPPAEEKPWHKALAHYVSDPRNGVLMSRDGGATWTEHGDVRLTTDARYHGWAENNVVELADGRVVMLIRGDRLGGVLYAAESRDGGRTWPAYASKTGIPNPGSKATLHPLGGDSVALLHNPNPAARRPLALWVSFDGMKTWPYRRVLVPESSDGPRGNLNYPDGFVSQDRRWLHFAYDDNRRRAVYYRAKLPRAPGAGEDH